MGRSTTMAADRGEVDRLSGLLALHEAALESMSHGFCMVDAAQRILLYNQRFIELFGLRPEAARIGMPIRELIDHSAVCGNFPKAQADDVYRRRMEMMARGKPFELRRQFSQGRTYSLFYRPVANGGWVTLVEDVSERQRKEYDLRIKFERYDQAINQMTHGMCALDSEHRLVLFNQRFLDMYGLTSDIVKIGVPMREVIEEAGRRGFFRRATPDVVWQRLLDIMAPGKPYQLDQRLHRREFVVHGHPTQDGGWVALCEDVTERRRMEEQLRLQFERFDQALSHMSHGLCLFGPDGRLIVCNQRYIEIYGLDPAMVKPGVSHRDILAHWVDLGIDPGMSPENFYAARQAAVDGMQPAAMLLRMKDGRVVEATSRPTPNGGWISAHEEVTDRLHYEKALREQNMLLDAALENMAHGLCVFDKDWRIIVRNQRYLDIYGLTADDARPGTPAIDLVRHSLEHGVHTATQSAEEFFEDFKRRVTVDREPVLYRRLSNGRLIAVRHLPMENGGWVGTFEDITERERAAMELEEQYRRFDIALNNMVHGLCMFDADMRLIVSNKRYAEMFNLPPDFVRPGMMVREVIARSHALGNYRHRNITADEMYDAYVTSLNAGELVVHRHLVDGRLLKLTHQPMAQGGWVVIYEDITERHRAEQSIAHMARHDALTDLPNRVLFRERMAEGLSRVEGFGESLALLCLDLDNFKGVNDTLGHPIGDRLLGTIAQRILSAVGEDDTVARLGGDEFAVLQCNASARAAETLARKLVALLSEPVEIDGQEINSGVSIGIALAPNDGATADHLMKCADLALYRAKAEGRATFRFFEPDMDARIQARRVLELDLRRALAANEFFLVYQPQINLASNELIAMEALLRWRHGERGIVPPSEFIPLAEEMGLIVPLGEWVLREACKEAARWPDSIKIAVNLSPVQFRNRGLVAMVTHALAAARVAPHRLELEITEAVLLQDDETIVSMLHQLRALGVRISMDDFGTGYSSLSYLRSFPFDKIKIDRSFIKDVERNRDSASIIRAIASLGASLGIETTAEGIETDEQLDLVRRAGCTEMQGYLVSRPVAACDVAELIARFRRDVRAA